MFNTSILSWLSSNMRIGCKRSNRLKNKSKLGALFLASILMLSSSSIFSLGAFAQSSEFGEVTTSSSTSVESNSITANIEHESIVAGEPVRWIITVDQSVPSSNVAIEVPSSAQNFSAEM